MTDSWAIHSDLWTKLFNAIDDVGHENVRIIKIKAHRALRSARTFEERFGLISNYIADVLAKRGARLQLSERDQQRVTSAFELVQSVGMYIATAALCIAETFPNLELERQAKAVAEVPAQE